MIIAPKKYSKTDRICCVLFLGGLGMVLVLGIADLLFSIHTLVP